MVDILFGSRHCFLNIQSLIILSLPLIAAIKVESYPHSSNHDTNRPYKAIAEPTGSSNPLGIPRGPYTTQQSKPHRYRRLPDHLSIHLSTPLTRSQNAQYSTTAASKSTDHPRSHKTRLCHSTIRGSIQLGRCIRKAERTNPAPKLPMETPALLYVLTARLHSPAPTSTATHPSLSPQPHLLSPINLLQKQKHPLTSNPPTQTS